jgi:hypothetical protein
LTDQSADIVDVNPGEKRGIGESPVHVYSQPMVIGTT